MRIMLLSICLAVQKVLLKLLCSCHVRSGRSGPPIFLRGGNKQEWASQAANMRGKWWDASLEFDM